MIQRWDDNGPSPFGMFVLYADHVAAVADAEQRMERITREDDNRALWDNRQFNAALDAARKAIAALEYDGDYCKVVHSCDALTAIDALKGETNA
jgi:hypothetical protein